jgi:hypothetical protein
MRGGGSQQWPDETGHDHRAHWSFVAHSQKQAEKNWAWYTLFVYCTQTQLHHKTDAVALAGLLIIRPKGYVFFFKHVEHETRTGKDMDDLFQMAVRKLACLVQTLVGQQVTIGFKSNVQLAEEPLQLCKCTKGHGNVTASVHHLSFPDNIYLEIIPPKR